MFDLIEQKHVRYPIATATAASPEGYAYDFVSIGVDEINKISLHFHLLCTEAMNLILPMLIGFFVHIFLYVEVYIT